MVTLLTCAGKGVFSQMAEAGPLNSGTGAKRWR